MAWYVEPFTEWNKLLSHQSIPDNFKCGLSTALLSGIITIVLYKSSRLITPLFLPVYNKFPVPERRDWDTRYSSILHAFAIVIYTLYIFFFTNSFDETEEAPLMLRTNYHTCNALGLSLGYFVVDCVCTFKYQMGGLEMSAHHFGSLLAVAASMWTGEGHLYTLWMLVTEISTPFISIRYWLDKADMKKSRAYYINGIFILASWIGGRILIFPSFFKSVYEHRDQLSLLSPFCLFLILVVPAMLLFLNLFWFSKILKGAVKLYKPALQRRTPKKAD